jgi:hypothetical protein
MQRLLSIAGVAGLLAGPAAAQQIVGRRDATFSTSESVSRGDWVRINSPNGSIRIAAASGGRVEIRATKEVHRGSIEDIGFVVRRRSDGLTVCAVFDEDDECDEDGNYHSHRSRGWSRDHQLRVDFTVRIPAGVRVKAATGNGDVNIAGAGEEVQAATGNGRVDISGTTGTVKASTGNGRVTIEGAEGKVDATTGNGAVRVTSASGPVSASSGSGDIEVSINQLDPSSDMSFSTGNGRVDLLLPAGFGAEVEAGTGNGEVTTDFPIQLRGGRLNPRRLRGTIGSGGGHLTISSGNGDIALRRKP